MNLRDHITFEYQSYQLEYKINLPPSPAAKKYFPLLLILEDENMPLEKLFQSDLQPDLQGMILVSIRVSANMLNFSGNISEYHFQQNPAPATAALLKLMDHLLREFPVDFERIYLTGNSMGGILCWELMRRRIGLFAAALLIGSGTDLRAFQPAAATEIFLCHGIFDQQIPVHCSRELYLTLMDAHCNVKFKEIPGCEHDTLEEISNDPVHLQQLFAVRQKIFTSMPIPDTFSPVILDAYGFSAKILPEAGGNIYSLRHKKSSRELLREPHRIEELFHTPERFGIPILFPPNRIEGAAFFFEGKICRLPMNLPAQKLHLHGIAVNKPWELTGCGSDFAELKFVFGPESPEYEGFPFPCEIRRKYEITRNGLHDTITIWNCGTYNMPLGLGFHTAFPADYAVVRVGTSDREIEIDANTFLPTGRCLEWNGNDPRNPFTPFGKNIGFHAEQNELTLDNAAQIHGAELQYPEGTLKYHTDEKFGFWYTWNAGGLNDFLCLEPVSWMANALNLPIPKSRSGVRKLSPGQTITFISSLEFQQNQK